MTLEQRKKAFFTLGKYLATPDNALVNLINTAHFTNAWFTPNEVRKAVKAWSLQLNESDLNEWLHAGILQEEPKPKVIGLVLAGNIPMVGFHDILTVLASGHIALIKASSQDQKLIPFLLSKLVEIEPAFGRYIRFTDRLKDFDAVIATGSNNTSRYFEYYFGKVPNLIRKNRNSIAILSNEESKEQLCLLGQDIFDYYGLGCRNVSKLFVPADYNFTAFFEAIETYKSIADHHKYNNNYDYNKSIYLINNDKHYDNGFLLVKKDDRLASPLAVLYYEEYTNKQQLETRIKETANQIQCVVGNTDLDVSAMINFGESQQPRLWDYADGVNTLQFLISL